MDRRHPLTSEHDPADCHDCADVTIATLRAELAADRRAVMDALGGGITDASLKERILALRAERDEYRGELADCRDAHEMTRRRENRTREERTEARRRVDERTEEVRLARYYMGALLGIIDGDRERVSAALELLGCADRDALLTEAQAFVSAP